MSILLILLKPSLECHIHPLPPLSTAAETAARARAAYKNFAIQLSIAGWTHSALVQGSESTIDESFSQISQVKVELGKKGTQRLLPVPR